MEDLKEDPPAIDHDDGDDDYEDVNDDDGEKDDVYEKDDDYADEEPIKRRKSKKRKKKVIVGPVLRNPRKIVTPPGICSNLSINLSLGVSLLFLYVLLQFCY